MAKQKKVWVSDDGKEHSNESEALRADAKFWKEKAQALDLQIKLKEQAGTLPPSSKS